MASGVFSIRQQAQAAGHGAWTGSQTTPYVEYLVVAGGGGGQYGGAGAGGLLQGLSNVTSGASYIVTVGAGGSANSAGTGSNSVFGAITANGGGNGAYSASSATAGGSGGGQLGTSIVIQGGQGIFGQGNAGGSTTILASGQASSGGGGAGTVGLTNSASSAIGGNGGAGIASAISGIVTTYAGGGGGGSNSGTAGTGGAGGGGNGTTGTGSAGTPNTGGGGGGGNSGGGTGGSGIVIISYPDIYNAPSIVTGTVTTSTSGSGSLSFNGSTSYLNYGGQSGFAFGSNNFTIEFWFYNTASGATTIFYDSRAVSGSTASAVIYLNSGVLTYYVTANNIIGATPTINAWNHVAVVRNSGLTIMYLNGTQTGSTYTDSNVYVNGANSPTIGGQGYTRPATILSGFMSNVRVVNGSAVYTSNFTPSTIPLTAISNTVLLLNSNSGAYLADNSSNSFVATNNGNVTWNQASPFATGLGYKNRVYTWTGSGTITF